MVRRSRSNNPALSYLGVSAAEPPDTIVFDERDPDEGDFEFTIGTLWLRTDEALRSFQLLQKKEGLATWVQLYPVSDSPGAHNFITDDGTAVVNNGDISIRAGVGLQTRKSENNTLTIEPNQSDLGYVFMSNIGFAKVKSPDDSININFTSGGLELKVASGLLVGASDFQTDSGSASPDNSGQIDLLGGQNIETEATDSSEVTVRTKDAIYLPQSTSDTSGVFGIGDNRVLHIGGNTKFSESNIYVGVKSGNFDEDAFENVGVGRTVLRNVEAGASANIALGTSALELLTTGQNNIAIGRRAGFGVESGDSNILIGSQVDLGDPADSENIYIGTTSDDVSESNTIRIGMSSDVGTPSQDRFFAAGIHNVTPAGSDQQTVVIDEDGQLGSTTSGAATDVVASVITDDGTATPNSDDELDLIGGQNISIQASDNDITVETTDSINLPETTATATGTYRINDDPVMHTYGSTGSDSNAFFGVNAGNFTLQQGTALRNVGLGSDSLSDLSQGSNNTALGIESLKNLPNGNENVAVGFGAGNNYSTDESDNILISNEGSSGDNGTIRIGNPDDHTRAFMHGVYNKTPSASNVETVVMDEKGQLGTTDSTGGGSGNTVAFLAIVNSSVSFSGTEDFEYDLGQNGEMDERYDISNNFTKGGSGTPAQFTAPESGRYHFSAAGFIQGNPDVQPLTIIFRVNNSSALGAQVTAHNPIGSTAGSFSGTLDLQENDIVECRFNFFGEKPRITAGVTKSWWSGFKVT